MTVPPLLFKIGGLISMDNRTVAQCTTACEGVPTIKYANSVTSQVIASARRDINEATSNKVVAYSTKHLKK